MKLRSDINQKFKISAGNFSCEWTREQDDCKTIFHCHLKVFYIEQRIHSFAKRKEQRLSLIAQHDMITISLTCQKLKKIIRMSRADVSSWPLPYKPALLSKTRNGLQTCWFGYFAKDLKLRYSATKWTHCSQSIFEKKRGKQSVKIKIVLDDDVKEDGRLNWIK